MPFLILIFKLSSVKMGYAWVVLCQISSSKPGCQAPKCRPDSYQSKQLRPIHIESSLTFGTPRPEGPGNSFSTPSPTLCPKGPRTPLGGLKGRKIRVFEISCPSGVSKISNVLLLQARVRRTLQSVFGDGFDGHTVAPTKTYGRTLAL